MKNMDLGIQLYGPIANGSMNFRDLMAGLKNVGYKMAEPCISLDGKSGAPTFWQPEELADKFAVLNELGLEVISAHVSSVNYLDTIPVMCELADKYHVKQFVVGMPEATEAAVKERALVYRQLAAALEEHGAELLLHNGKPDMAPIRDITAYEYMIELCMGKLGMQFDTGWAARGGVDPMVIIRRSYDSIRSLHYKDFNMNNDTDVDVCIGDGTLDNEDYMKFGQEKGIPIFVDADTYDKVLDDAARSYRYLMSISK